MQARVFRRKIRTPNLSSSITGAIRNAAQIGRMNIRSNIRNGELFDIENYEIKADFGLLYGAEFAHLSNEKPDSIFMAKGSEVSVYKGAKL